MNQSGIGLNEFLDAHYNVDFRGLPTAVPAAAAIKAGREEQVYDALMDLIFKLTR